MWHPLTQLLLSSKFIFDKEWMLSFTKKQNYAYDMPHTVQVGQFDIAKVSFQKSYLHVPVL